MLKFGGSVKLSVFGAASVLWHYSVPPAKIVEILQQTAESYLVVNTQEMISQVPDSFDRIPELLREQFFD